ncbi:zinc finger protein 30 [Drosophila serrata]|uniref:zinc finger protein 30 n=1 Tax=Drosophila serrata TaxID=7274 RepID=UPI000A1D0B9B|nr:zinc finger protein 30 [Drosophila serrata]
MKTCGVICVSGDYEKFLMRCSHCPTDVELAQWQEFVLHFRNMHSFLVPLEQKVIKDQIEKTPENFVIEIQDEETPETFTVEEILMDQEEFKVESNIEINIEARDSLPDEAQEFLFNEEEIKEHPNMEMKIEALDSSPDESEEESEVSGGSDQEAEVSDPPGENADINPTPTYKFRPTFFRRDPRTIKFIEVYKTHPCLWDSKHKDFKEPGASTKALKQMLTSMDASVSVVLSEGTLKMAIKKLHTQYNTVQKRVLSGKQKPQSLAYNVYTLCSFLKDSRMQEESGRDQEEAGKGGKIQLDFSKKNKLTTDLIKMYSNFPQLYDPSHKEFCSMSSRKQAYESLAAKTSVPHEVVNSDDIFRAIQSLRQWYYKTMKYAINAGDGAEKFYMKMCRFLPPKMFKQRLVCEICKLVMSSDHVLQAHIFKVHNIGELPFKCTLCDRSFMARVELSNHMQRFHIGKTHKCNHCERFFAVVSDLQLHIRTHTGHKPYVCEHCGKAFRLGSQMKLHVTAIHTKIRAFKCTMCPKDFVKKVDWSDHMKGHLNIRDKICTVCGKGFTSCHSLIRHRQIHSEVKKFVCKLCDSRFSQFVGLNSHMKRTHNIVRKKQQKDAEADDAEN